MAVNSISAGITSFMASANIGIVPVRMQGIEMIWAPPGSRQDPIVPLLMMDEASVRSMFQSDQGAAIRSSLFSNYQKLRAMIHEASGDAHKVLNFVREKAEKHDKAGSHDAAAMLRELAFDMDNSDRHASTDIAKSWLVSLREYTESESDRIRISRGLLYGWAERDYTVYRPLLRTSFEVYTGSGRNIMAAAGDQLRIALAVSEEASLEADDYGVISDMLKVAATMFADSWQEKIDIGPLTDLADQAAALAEKGR